EGDALMQFDESDEHRALRESVRAIASKFGHRYYVERAERGEPCIELWSALGDAGFIGVNLPEAFGGGGAGMVELAMVCEETAAAGCPLLLLLVSSAISGEMIARFGTSEQQERWLPRMATGASKVVF